jgi:ring-1,2-phenylacetyl-CoA epoxidase subunit PaaC
MMIESLTQQPLHRLLLAMADDEFILGYRNSEWTGIAPMLEEDVAFSSMSQDEIGHARLFYEMLAGFTGISADKIAYARQPEEYTNCRLVEHRRLDWAYTTARQFLYDLADHVRLEALSNSSHEPLANASQKILREEKYHLMHGDMWMNRLATLSEASKEKLQAALDEVWPDALGIFEPLSSEEDLVSQGVLATSSAGLQAEWLSQLAPYFANLGLPFPAKEENGNWVPSIEPVYGGRRGQHTEEFTTLREEMTEVYRLEPDAVW